MSNEISRSDFSEVTPLSPVQTNVELDMSVNFSLNPLFYHCFDSGGAVLIFNAFIVTKCLLCVPLSTLVFYLGHKRWRIQQGSTKTTSHSNVITFHTAAVELSGLVACLFYFCGTYTDMMMMAKVGFNIFTMVFPGEMWFHSLACVERYLAVVHPITYRGLGQSWGGKIRNISIGCAWLLCCTWVGAVAADAPKFPTINFFCFTSFSLFVVSFCSLSVLCALIHPGPRDEGTDEKRLDQSKRRAFHTVTAISAVQWLWFTGFIVCVALDSSLLLSYNDGCVVMMFGVCLILLPFSSSSLSCFTYRTTTFIAAAFTVTKTFLLLPLCILVLYMGHLRWRQQHSFATTSHSDIFTYYMIFIEFISVLGWTLFCCGNYINLPLIVLPGYHIMFIVFPGQMFFHCLTCVERYLAVVHPITYLGLRQSSGVWIRNIGIGFVWLLCLGWIGITVLPGEVGGKRERVDQSKQRAVTTILAIMAVLLLYFVGFVVCIALHVAQLLSHRDGCMAFMYINMSVNVSFFNFSLNSYTNTCFGSEVSVFVFSAVFINNLLLLPVFILIFYLGYLQRRQQASVSLTATSHSNLFTYHAIAMQMNELLGLSLFFGGGYMKRVKMILVGQSFMKVTSTGQGMFHILTCVEHYLAVVHPITYLHLRQAGEVRIRNFIIGCVWLLSFGWLVVYYVGSDELNWILYFCTMVIELVGISFCNISVLCTLKRPGPGDTVGNKERVDQSKQKAFYTIFAIMGLFFLRFVGNASMSKNMSVNSSSSNSSIQPLTNTCFRSEKSILIFSAFSITNLLLLPLYILVLYLGYQQWRQGRSMSAAAASHSDLFTYNAISMQMIEFLGLSFLFCGSYNNMQYMSWIGLNALFVTSTGQAMFHVLTCVEHYLAVVHPITYLHMRQAGELRIRNISTACACISVLCALKRPGPGEVGGKKEQCAKQRAFYTILVIMGVFLFSLVRSAQQFGVTSAVSTPGWKTTVL
ncbi:hypothetical protein Q8A73_012623 [Channa argus]|nr:hypothetical protein Q8A73_012623 [Channa argus]